MTDSPTNSDDGTPTTADKYLDTKTPCFLLNCASSEEWFTHPRFARVTLGMGLIGLGLIGVIDGRYADVSLVAGMLTAVGIFFASQAIYGDFFLIRKVSFSASGVSVYWSCARLLWGKRIEQCTEISWDEITSIEWQEGALEVDMKQHLIFQLKSPLCKNRRQIKILICDTHDFDCCSQLLNYLPANIKQPHWLVKQKIMKYKESA